MSEMAERVRSARAELQAAQHSLAVLKARWRDASGREDQVYFLTLLLFEAGAK